MIIGVMYIYDVISGEKGEEQIGRNILIKITHVQTCLLRLHLNLLWESSKDIR